MFPDFEPAPEAPASPKEWAFVALILLVIALLVLACPTIVRHLRPADRSVMHAEPRP